MRKKLTDRAVLVLDLQATGSNPETSAILEAGWAVVTPGTAEPGTTIESRLIGFNEEEAVIPKRVLRITGITQEELENGVDIHDVWLEILSATKVTAEFNKRKTCPTVIHYARYERPFLEQLFCRFGGAKAFPFDIICTHEIVKRLYPGIPRRGLRAVAGYFGHSVDEKRRASHHVAATAAIWARLANELDTMGLKSFSEIKHWLSTSTASARTGREYSVDSDVRLSFPDSPGIYRMQRSNGDILYIGKAKSLKKRVNSYFQKKKNHPEHILEMLTQAVSVDVTPTQSALEAALLENDEIKRLSPPYNKALRTGERPLVFCSEDFESLNTHADSLHRLGPFLSTDIPMALKTIAVLIETHDDMRFDETTIASALAIPAEYAPGYDIFLEGLHCFMDKYGLTRYQYPTMPQVKRVGLLVWKERHLTAMEETDDTGTPEDEAVREEPVWTAGTVLSSLESVFSRTAWFVRRGRWFTLLSNSTISWLRKAESAGERRLLVIKNAEIADRQYRDINEPIRQDSGKAKSRDSFFIDDIAAYERMRVLTTELRRLIKERKQPAIYAGKHILIREQVLDTILAYI